MTSDRTAAFLEEIMKIALDPATRAFAMRLAGTPDLAEDALQEAFYLVARAPRPETIGELRARFRSVLVREIYRSHRQAEAPVADIEVAALSDRGQRVPAPSQGIASADLDSEVYGLLLAEALLARLERRQAELMALIPGRSPDPLRYRESIVAAAEAILRTAVVETVSRGDLTAALREGYPEWYHRDAANHFQRLSRAREDVHQLLQALTRDKQLFTSPQPPAHGASPADRDVRTADDAALTALFLKSGQTRLPHETPYNLDQGLELFTAWLDSQTPDRARERTQD
jgi:DNA-directed RNA polymerase specialized sigma24 family protein